MSSQENTSAAGNYDIAVVGMSCRFPGANNISEFWKNLCAGVESVSFFTDDELMHSGVDPRLIKDPNYIKARGIIDNVDKFDARFFGVYPKEAETMDPQHRLFLECAWEALEDAGCNPQNYNGLIGVWGGAGMNTYLLPYLNNRPAFISSSEGYQLSIGNEKDFLSTRVSYKLNLKGPSLDIQTACSTSLVAIHSACLNLLNYQCDAAIAGGVNIFLPQKTGYYYQEGMILSPDGHCRPFDADANGTLGGNGAGVVLLKRLSDAISDKDNIYSVIKASACNNDGADKAGFTAPGMEGQIQVIAMAQMLSGIDPATIQYIEAHGTGTSIGDPVEIASLTKVFGESTPEKNFCAIGSVKSNIGHLDAAAGVAGFIKTVLSLYYSKIPPSINYKKDNPKIDFHNSPFFVAKELRDWKTNNLSPRRAAVSSFGIGGTNAHIILEEAPAVNIKKPPQDEDHLFIWSAKSQYSISKMRENLIAYLNYTDDSPDDIAFTLQSGRKEFNIREAIVAKSKADAADKIKSNSAKAVISNILPGDQLSPRLCFMFSGQGSQYIDMGKDLYENHKVFRDSVNYCAEYLEPMLKLDIRKIIYPSKEDKIKAEEKINQTYITQPALFIIEYSLAKLLNSWGIAFDIMTGHSIGEFTAACLSGVMALEEALKIVWLRASLMQELPSGVMLAVMTSEEEIIKIIPETVSIAAVNGPEMITLSGNLPEIEKLEVLLEQNNLEFRRLQTSHAFHSSMMDPVLGEFENAVRKLKLENPKMPYMSNLSGKLIKASEAMDPAYYSRHLRSTVRFSDNAEELLKDKNIILLEIGPGNVLSTLAKSQPMAQPNRILSAMRHPKDEKNDCSILLSAVGKLWALGVKINWDAFNSNKDLRKVSMPSYPFDRKRYWMNVTENPGLETGGEKRKDVHDWFYIPSWRRGNLKIKSLPGIKKWLILAQKDDTIDDMISDELMNSGQVVTRVLHGKSFRRIDDQLFIINPFRPEDYQRLLEILSGEDKLPENIIHLWSMEETEIDEIARVENDGNEYLGYFSLIYLARAIDSLTVRPEINISVVVSNLFEVTENEISSAENATVLAPALTIPQEYPNMHCRLLDIGKLNVQGALIPGIIISESLNETSEPIVAYRGKYRWYPVYEKIETGQYKLHKSMLKTHGVYLITGGLGKIGLIVSELLSEKYKAGLILTTTSLFPNRKKWQNWIETHAEDDLVSAKIKKITELESLGAKILVVNADVSNLKEMKEAVDIAIETFGELNGVIHSAGVTGEKVIKTIKDLTQADFELQIKPKIEGVKVLREALKRKKVDFVLLQSSLSTILGGIGFTAYAAANCFMDAYVYKLNKTQGTKWISANWDGWKFISDPAGSDLPALKNRLIEPEEGKRAFEILLSEFVSPRIIVSLSDISKLRRQENDKPVILNNSLFMTGEVNTENDRPEILTAFVEPATDTEKQVALIWKSLLGINQIGVNDNFFDIGGNSLLGTQLVTSLRQKYECELPLKALFEDPTISGIAVLIDSQQAEIKSRIIKVDEVLKQVSSLSDEEVMRLLNQKNIGHG